MIDAARLGALLERPVVVADVGARWGCGDRWRPFGPSVEVIGFDPDPEECERLGIAEPDVTYVPVALGDFDGTTTLHLARERACSSIYPPVDGLHVTHPELSVIAPDGTEQVGLRRLDSWLAETGRDAVHIMKIDTQGSELGVLEGSEQALSSVRMLEIEVEFNPIYAGQPLFGDVDRFLRDRGFVLWRLAQLVHYSTAGTAPSTVADRQYFDSQPVEFEAAHGQLFWGHAYFVASGAADGSDTDRDVALADAVAATAFGYQDLAADRLRSIGIDPASLIGA